jgi:small subunit ribosomal protein S5
LRPPWAACRKGTNRAMSAERESGAEELEERVVRVDRTRKTVAGGRVSSARVVVAVGDGKGSVGVGVGKALDVPGAIEKGVKAAKKAMIRIPLDGYTIPHTIQGKSGGAVILLRPASRGTGIIAGGAVRQIIDVSGIRDILTKSLGSGNVFNRAMACFNALESLYDPHEIAERREKTVEEIVGRTIEDPYELAETEAQQKAEEQAAAAAEAEEVQFEEALLGSDEEQAEDVAPEAEEPEPAAEAEEMEKEPAEEAEEVLDTEDEDEEEE